tara:strand:+ start:35 stop:1012 length:978 start_codon:yes stop_codon:yes gene_type:complete
MDYLSTLITQLKEKRPHLAEGSVNMYRGGIISLFKTVNDKNSIKAFTNLDWLDDSDKVSKEISDMPLQTQKILFQSASVFLDAQGKDELVKKYRAALFAVKKLHDKETEGQNKTVKEEENWCSWKSLEKVRNNYKQQLMNLGLLDAKITPDKVKPSQMALFQKWVITSLYTYQPPVRADYAMDILSQSEYDAVPDEEKSKNNYLVINKREKFFHFNKYKTHNLHGDKRVKVNKPMNAVLNKWLNINKSGWLLLNIKKEPVNENQLGKAVTVAFEPCGKRIGINMLRKIYLTEKYQHEKAEKKADADAMLHSVSTQQKEYVKYEKE